MSSIIQQCSLCKEWWLIFMFRTRTYKGVTSPRRDCIWCCQARDRRYHHAHKAECNERSRRQRLQRVQEGRERPVDKREDAYTKRVFRVLHPDRDRAIRQRHYYRHQAEILAQKRSQPNTRYATKKAEILKQQAVYVKRREQTDPGFRILRRLRGRCRDVLVKQRADKAGTTRELFGAPVEFVRQHLEAQFRPGMTWANHGRGPDRWHIDHIKPCAAFDLTDPAQQRACFHWTNLQPLWETENLSKGASVAA